MPVASPSRSHARRRAGHPEPSSPSPNPSPRAESRRGCRAARPDAFRLPPRDALPRGRGRGPRMGRTGGDGAARLLLPSLSSLMSKHCKSWARPPWVAARRIQTRRAGADPPPPPFAVRRHPPSAPSRAPSRGSCARALSRPSRSRLRSRSRSYSFAPALYLRPSLRAGPSARARGRARGALCGCAHRSGSRI